MSGPRRTSLGLWLTIATVVALALPLAGSATTPRDGDVAVAPDVATVAPGFETSDLQRLSSSTSVGCTSGAHTLSHFGDRVYPEMGNGGYTSLHTDVT